MNFRPNDLCQSASKSGDRPNCRLAKSFFRNTFQTKASLYRCGAKRINEPVIGKWLQTFHLISDANLDQGRKALCALRQVGKSQYGTDLFANGIILKSQVFKFLTIK